MNIAQRLRDEYDGDITQRVLEAAERGIMLDGKGRQIVKLPPRGEDGFRYATDDSIDALMDVIEGYDDPNRITEADLQPEYTIAKGGASKSGKRRKKPPKIAAPETITVLHVHDDEWEKRSEFVGARVTPTAKEVLSDDDVSIADQVEVLAAFMLRTGLQPGKVADFFGKLADQMTGDDHATRTDGIL